MTNLIRLAALATVLLQPWTPFLLDAEDVTLEKDGIFRFAGQAVLKVMHSNPNWKACDQRSAALKQQRQGTKTVLDGSWVLRDGTTALFTETIRRPSENLWDIAYRIKAGNQPIATDWLVAELAIPLADFFGKPVIVNGRNYFLPETAGKDAQLHKFPQGSRVEIPLKEGLLSIESNASGVKIYDNRTFQQDNCAVRFGFTPDRGNLKQSELRLKVRYQPCRMRSLNLAAAANMGFVDRISGDGKGGWTDQGPTNDLRSISVGAMRAGPLSFTVLDPEKNRGKSCIVLGGAQRRQLPSRAEIDGGEKSGRTLALLHAAAWPRAGAQIGTITVTFADQSTTSLTVKEGRDVGDWWNPALLSNGMVAWHGASADNGFAGLYGSVFQIPEKPVKKIEFLSLGSSVWGIVAVSIGDDPVYFPKTRVYVTKSNASWRRFETVRSIAKNSALDFSFLLDAPAGKYGPVTVRDGHMVFEKQGKPLRFYGTNLCFWGLYLPHKEADELADRISRIGYNAVRLHHFDRDLVVRGARDSITIDPKRMEELDYLIAAFKKRGIYLTTDLFTARRYVPGEYQDCPDLEEGYAYKLAAMLLPEVRERLKKFVREVFTHKNPYTNLTWAEDPVFLGISILNENTIFSILEKCRASKAGIVKRYDAAFEQFLASRQLVATSANRDELYRQFCLEVYHNYYNDMVAFLRGIGVRNPLTDQNFMNSPNDSAAREKYDYVDNHIYWDHPVAWGPKHMQCKFFNVSVLQSGIQSPRLIAPTRIYGKPFWCTEFDFCYPNRFRSEGAVIFGAYAAMQDWDGIFRFDYAGSRNAAFVSANLEPFDTVNDAIRLLSERIGLVMFLRRDVKVAEEKFVVAVSRNAAAKYCPSYPEAAHALMLYGRVGSVLADRDGRLDGQKLPEGTRAVLDLTGQLPGRIGAIRTIPGAIAVPHLAEELCKAGVALSRANNTRKAVSCSGELAADFSEHTFTVSTARCEAMVLPAGRSRRTGVLEAAAKDTFSTVSAISLENRPLVESNRILLLHLTDVQLEGMKFDSADMRKVLHYSSGKLLAKKGIATIRLRLAGKFDGTIYALDLHGNRIAPIAFKRASDGAIVWDADTFRVPKQVVFAYELVRNQADSSR
ncbi:MAG: hypothetical protein PHS41_01500 [Victivallaceae bacterium]|nr:hypothetical protein [Victivallaceae bacterium]